MIKKILYIVLMISLFLSAGCTSQKEKRSNDTELCVGGQMAISNEGIYLFEKSNEGNPVLYFYDRNSEKLVPLCQNANCEHNDMSCYAYQLGTIDNNKNYYVVFSITYYAQRLYLAYIGLSGSENIIIKSVSMDGSDMKTEYESTEVGLINGFCIFQNKLIISRGYLAKDEADHLIGTATINTICTYDLETKEEKIIANEKKEKDIMVYPIGSKENNIYYYEINFSNGINKGKIMTYDIKNESKKTIGEYNETVNLMYNDNIYYTDNNNIIGENIMTNKKKIIFEGNFVNSIVNVAPYGYLTYIYQGEDNVYYTLLLDLDSEEKVFDDDLNNASIIGKYEDEYFIYNDQKEIVKYNTKNKKEVVLYN